MNAMNKRTILMGVIFVAISSFTSAHSLSNMGSFGASATEPSEYNAPTYDFSQINRPTTSAQTQANKALVKEFFNTL